MITKELTGSIKALLDEYKKSINELVCAIKPLSEHQLLLVVDNKTDDEDCKSIQTILTHVVCSGYGYTIYIENSIGLNKVRLDKINLNTSDEYIDQLNLMFEYCENFFKNNTNLIIEEHEISKKMIVNSGQQYDIEQLMEHAIVHVLRHRRQIERYIKSL